MTLQHFFRALLKRRPTRIGLTVILGLLAYREGHYSSSGPSQWTVKHEIIDPSSSMSSGHQIDSSLLNNATASAKFAYAYSIAGCTEDSCVGYILNSVVASAILRRHNSTSDIVLIVRMNRAVSAEQLPPEQEQWIQKSGIRLLYVPKVAQDNFATATLEKFRVLELLDYDRVRFFDADLIPLCNLDREFMDSYEGRLQGFVGKRGTVAPITGSDFMVTPQRGLFARTMNLIDRARNRQDADKGGGRWNPKIGWGHEFQPGEKWKAGRRSGIQWDFYGATVDQGILYQLFRYEVGSWSDTSAGEHVAWEETDELPAFGNNPEMISDSWTPLSNGRWAKKLPPEPQGWKRAVCLKLGKYDLYNFHYNGNKKPWRTPVSADKIPASLEDPSNSKKYWFYWLGVANRTFDLQFPSSFVPGEAKNSSTKSASAASSAGNPLGYSGLHDANILFSPDTEIPRPYLEDYQRTAKSNNAVHVYSSVIELLASACL